MFLEYHLLNLAEVTDPITDEQFEVVRGDQCEQGLVEGAQRKTQLAYGVLLKDVLRCGAEEVGELIHVVEFFS